MSKKIAHLLIVGAGPQALFLLREFSRMGFNILLLGRPNEIAMHSKYGEKIRLEKEEDLVKILRQLALEKEQWTCYVASGFYLAYLLNHYPEFYIDYQVIPNNKESVTSLISKSKSYLLAEKVKLDYPKSVLLKELEERKDWSDIRFPQIVKWDRDIYLYTKPRFKTAILNTLEELRQLLQKCSPKEKEALIMQEYLGADLKNNISYGAYVLNGKPQLGICVNEVRHYRSGVSSMVEEYTGAYAAEIESKASQLLAQTGFTGFLDVEFKIFKDRIYLLEVNPRPFGFIRILKLKYPDLIPFVLGLKTEAAQNPYRVKWINCMRDMVLILKAPKHLFHMLSVLLDFKGRTFDVWDSKDPKPFFYQLKR
ncbi:hypothetical protein [Ancylomarina longa]|uniref:ATP-grasp domain-containing protein n=1 Tax=Ancylomarina longa TaxID=2487017 RepID=A0A434AU65_9BACT|nr:hypothetical protein [Ancylomarina longa]RUT77883.1 hypothetical protein DLK05_11125 [Ancylomarina longa]